MQISRERYYSVGEVAEKSGVTIRTLQFYDKSGLLTPSQHTEGGRRLYGWSDLMKLQQILFLKSFGFSLEEIKDRMRFESGREFVAVLAQQRDVLAGQVQNMERTISLMDRIIAGFHDTGEVGTEQLIAIIEMMKTGSPYTFIMKYINNDQIKKLIDVNRPDMPSASVAPDWQNAFSRVVALHKAGVDPKGPEGQEFAAQWWDMVLKSTGGDPELIKALMEVGKDVDNWPEETAEFREAIRVFLAEALQEYFIQKPFGEVE